MKVLFFGSYDVQFNRTWTFLRACEAVGIEIVHCQIRKKKHRLDVTRWFEAFWKLYTAKRTKHDLVFVAYPGIYLMPVALLVRGCPVIYDALVSYYDKEVEDERSISRYNPIAWYLWFRDWLALHLADGLTTETEAHKLWFINRFSVSSQKIFSIEHGANLDNFSVDRVRSDSAYARTQTDKFLVLFVGRMEFGVQGVDVVLDAAEKTNDPHVMFRIAGGGSKLKYFRSDALRRKLDNVEFLGKIPYEDVPKEIYMADAILGLFGATDRTKHAMPNKLIEGAALGKALIIEDAPATRELFDDGVSGVFAQIGDSDDIARCITLLKSNPELRELLGRNARALYTSKLSLRTLGESLYRAFNKTVSR